MSLYPKSHTSRLEEALFQSPTAEYRAAPFWSWNNTLPYDELTRQIDCFREMGFGGFHMHCRTGLDLPYLSEEFMERVKHCAARARANGLLSWLYDEDGYSSGFAGGKVTAEPVHRNRRLQVTTAVNTAAVEQEKAVAEGLPYLVAAYDVALTTDGTLEHYARVEEAAAPAAEGYARWYAYCVPEPLSGWYNDYTYADTMSQKTVERFLDITLGAYAEAVGEELGRGAPAIFTDEPAMAWHRCLGELADDLAELHWTPDLPATFAAAYGYDILDRLPELVWDRPGEGSARTRWQYHDHACERFVSAYMDTYGRRCEALGLAMTGHVLDEDTLPAQTRGVGEAMRCYRGFTIPGIDVLSNHIRLLTAKQCQSAVHQYGREGMLSELYGVTGWEFDFRGHKFQGDWQAAMGVTVRVPHLAWVSMKGSNKRDYPAPIGPQSPWYKEYGYVEDHFARVNTALTRGKPVVRIGLLHPMESDWVMAGPHRTNDSRRQAFHRDFEELMRALLFHSLDHDLIGESQLPRLAGGEAAPFTVGEMAYDAVVVPPMLTVRSTILARLERFADAGGLVVFAGDCPAMVDALPDDRARALYDRCPHAQGDYETLCALLQPVRELELHTEDGQPVRNMLYQLRQDGEERWLFLARGTYPGRIDRVERRSVTVTLTGGYTPTLYNTQTGTTAPIAYEIEGGRTHIHATLYDLDSLLLRLSPPVARGWALPATQPGVWRSLPVPALVDYRLTEENCYLLDRALCRMDEEAETDETVLEFDRRTRCRLGYPCSNGAERQPWTLPDKPYEHVATLTFTVESTAEMTVALAYEAALSVTLNGEAVDLTPVGFYVDSEICKTAPVLSLRRGTNTLVMRVPMAPKMMVENAYLLGDFSVECRGSYLCLHPREPRLAFADITRQGLPFYGGNVVYSHQVETPAGDLRITLPHYRGACVRVYMDGKDAGMIAYAPYQVTVRGLAAGTHRVEYRLYGHRENAFGRVVHNTADRFWYGMGEWHPEPVDLALEYRQVPIGILTAPRLEMLK